MQNKKKIVILTGAGISAEAGIKTFRESEGLWENHKIDTVATYTGFQKNQQLVYDFYNQRRSELFQKEMKPTRAHLALAQLEEEYDGEVVVITQNIDNLHERAGTKNLLHIHGELLKMQCLQSGERFKINKDLTKETKCKCCKEPSSLRPDIVWFGEEPYHLDAIAEHLHTADHFMAIGTSAEVYPAAMFINMVSNECNTIEINIEKTGASWRFKENFLGKASIEVPRVVLKFLDIL